MDGTKTSIEDSVPPPEEWINAEEIPLSRDITSVCHPSLFPSPRQTSQPDGRSTTLNRDTYLQIEYSKLYYEAVQPLRNAFQEYRSSTTNAVQVVESSNIYTDVRFLGFMLTDDGVATRISFTLNPPEELDWSASKRLRPGALVLLSPAADNFKSKTLLAVVAYRFLCGGLEPNLDAGEAADTPPRIDLFCEWDADFLDSSSDYVMLESKSGYFESVRYAMKGLQQSIFERSSLDDYILGAKNVDQSNLPSSQVQEVVDTASLDTSQLDALNWMMTKQLALVQGPPGTGKTFTAVTYIRESISRTAKPIIIAAQTNHAVDQLLTRCADSGLTRLCRLGSRCSKPIEEFRIFNLRETSKHMSNPAIQKIVRPARRAIIDIKSTLVKTLQALVDGTQSHLYKAETFHKNGVLSTKQYESLQNNDWATDEEDPLLAWLNRQKPSLPESRSSSPQKKERPRIIPTPRDPEEPRGTFIELSTGNVPGSRGWKPSRQAIRQLLTVQDLYKVKSQRRDDMYHVMCYKLRESYMEQAQNQILRYNEACKALTEQKRLRDAALIRKERIQVVGCTVTGLCKYRALIKDLAPEIMLIDEASEAFEATITAALFPSLQQLSLVGDHQQLTPRSGSRLASLDVSLFERLIGMIDYKVLLCQRRMVPNIRSVISGFYPQIRDHITVTQRHTRFSPNLWWFDHSWPESITAKKSFCNTTEAEMVVQLAQHLLSNGTAAEKITILSFYTGQKEAITKLLDSKRQQGDADNFESDKPAQHGDVSRVAVRTVDGFQGCENNVIILSLVRSRRPGFIADVHRATVALSRARDAMFVFGSTSTLTHSGSRCFASWAGVLNSFQQQAAIGPHLPNTAEWNDVLQQIVTADGAESGLQQPAMIDKKDWLDAQQVPAIFVKMEKSLDVDTVLLKFDSDLLIDIGYSTATSKSEGAHIPQMDQSAQGMLIDLEEESCIEDLIRFD